MQNLLNKISLFTPISVFILLLLSLIMPLSTSAHASMSESVSNQSDSHSIHSVHTIKTNSSQSNTPKSHTISDSKNCISLCQINTIASQKEATQNSENEDDDIFDEFIIESLSCPPCVLEVNSELFTSHQQKIPLYLKYCSLII